MKRQYNRRPADLPRLGRTLSVVVLVWVASGCAAPRAQEKPSSPSRTIALEDPLSKVERLERAGQLDAALAEGEQLLSVAGDDARRRARIETTLARIQLARAAAPSAANPADDRAAALRLAQAACRRVTAGDAEYADAQRIRALALVANGQPRAAGQALTDLAAQTHLPIELRATLYRAAAEAWLTAFSSAGTGDSTGNAADSLVAARKAAESGLALTSGNDALKPQQAGLAYVLGNVLSQARQTDAAADAYARAAQAAPADSPLQRAALQGQAAALLELGRIAAAAEVAGKLTDRTDPYASLLQGRVAAARGDYAAARSEFATAKIAAARQPRFADDVSFQTQLALARASAAQGAGDLAGAERELSAAIETAERHEASPALVADLRANLGRVQSSRYEFEAADKSLQTALKAQLALFGAGQPEPETTRLELAALERERAYFDKAAEYARTALDGLAKNLPADHPLVVDARLTCAALAVERADCPDAVKLAREAVAGCKDAPPTVATPAFLRMALILHACPDAVDAAALNEVDAQAAERVAALVKAVGPDDLRALNARITLADLTTQTDPEREAALQLYRDVADRYDRQRRLPPCHPEMLKLRLGEAKLLGQLHRWDEAQTIVEQALRDCQAGDVQADTPQIARLYEVLGLALEARGEKARARQAYQDALSQLEKIYNSDHPQVQAFLKRLGAG